MAGRTAALSGHLGRSLQPLHVDLPDQALDLARLDEARTEALGRLGAARHAEARHSSGADPYIARDEAGQEGVAGADRGDGLARLDPDAVQDGARRSRPRPRIRRAAS